MSILKQSKINRLIGSWPHNTVKTTKILSEAGYSNQLLKKYVATGWLMKIGVGAFAKVGDSINWRGCLYALQKELKLPIHVGGLSALNYHGLGQYVMPNEKVRLYNTSDKRTALPSWFRNISDEYCYYQHHLFENNKLGLIATEFDGIELKISCPERALLECMVLVPNQFSFDHMYELSENAQLLDPTLMQALLENCCSIKVKRLFLFMADSHRLPCFEHLKIDAMNLGRGKRKIGEGGYYSSKYKISVPIISQDVNEEIP